MSSLDKLMVAYLTVILFLCVAISTGISSRCFVCNSRGELGDCKDPFTHNATSFKDLPGAPVGIATCPSGWCRKRMEIVKGRAEDHGVATDRHCLQNPPSDNEERCAKIVNSQNKPALLCFCRGDLCNSSIRLSISLYTILGLSTISIISSYLLI